MKQLVRKVRFHELHQMEMGLLACAIFTSYKDIIAFVSNHVSCKYMYIFRFLYGQGMTNEAYIGLTSKRTCITE